MAEYCRRWGLTKAETASEAEPGHEDTSYLLFAQGCISIGSGVTSNLATCCTVLISVRKAAAAEHAGGLIVNY